MNEKTNTFHKLAKEAGNKLRAYILSVSSGSTAVLFLSLTTPEAILLTKSEKILLIISLISFVLTVFISLYELRIDAKRFFNVAQELQKSEEAQCWRKNNRLKRLRYLLIHSTYITLSLGLISLCIFLINKILIT